MRIEPSNKPQFLTEIKTWESSTIVQKAMLYAKLRLKDKTKINELYESIKTESLDLETLRSTIKAEIFLKETVDLKTEPFATVNYISAYKELIHSSHKDVNIINFKNQLQVLPTNQFKTKMELEIHYLGETHLNTGTKICIKTSVFDEDDDI